LIQIGAKGEVQLPISLPGMTAEDSLSVIQQRQFVRRRLPTKTSGEASQKLIGYAAQSLSNIHPT
jgi:hypothetical protein